MFVDGMSESQVRGPDPRDIARRRSRGGDEAERNLAHQLATGLREVLHRALAVHAGEQEGREKAGAPSLDCLTGFPRHTAQIDGRKGVECP